MTTVDKILDIEWEMFSSTQNEGGKASCQEDKAQFEIMRRAQFSIWDEASLDSWLADLLDARTEGRNLMAEKYARMMESTAPSHYENIKDALPELSQAVKTTAAELAEITVRWADGFAEKYPKVASRGRPIHKSADNLYTTSVETYNYGEALTYGEKTARLLLKRYKAAETAGDNLYIRVLEATARLSGFASLDEAEKTL